MGRMIDWFARNGVAANILMLCVIAGGIFAMHQIVLEVFPELSVETITISVVYRGASPEEVEEGVCVRIEEQIQGLEGIKKITSTASENQGVVTVEALEGTNIERLLDDIKARVDAIDTFPQETEEPVIKQVVIRHQVLSVVVSGNIDERSLKNLSEKIRDEIESLPDVTLVEITGARPYEISVEISETALRKYHLMFDDIAGAIRRFSLDLPGGEIKSESGVIRLRAKGQAYRGHEFEKIPLMTKPDGTVINLGDVAHVVDGFEDVDRISRFNGKPAHLIQVYRVGSQSVLKIAKEVKDYVKEKRDMLPPGVDLTVWMDQTDILKDRMNLLFRNGRNGLILVFLVLLLFLEFRFAFWTTIGIPVAFLGAVFMMPILDVSLNMVSLFAFVVVLGIVVDDAIVVSENAFTFQNRMEDKLDAVISGTQEISVPVIFAVLTTVAAFFPLIFVPGSMGKIMRVIPLIIIPTLLTSLIESQLVLPRHLYHVSFSKVGTFLSRPLPGFIRRLPNTFSSGLNTFIYGPYLRFLEKTLAYRYITVALFTALLIIIAGFIAGGHLHFSFFPDVEADMVIAHVTLPNGTPVEKTAEVVGKIENSALELRRELNGSENERGPFRYLLATIGDQPYRGQMRQSVKEKNFSASNVGELIVQLSPSDERNIGSVAIGDRWRDLTGTIPGVTELTFSSSLFSVGAPINIQLSGLDMTELNEVSAQVKKALAHFPGVYDITDSYQEGKQEIKLHLKPQATLLGLTRIDLARQVRQAFYGEEAQRIQRGRDDIRVMVRYPASDRKSPVNLENMWIRTPNRSEVPISAVADYTFGRGYDTITRTDRKRSINVTANIDKTRISANEILSSLRRKILPQILASHPDITFSFEGENREQQDSIHALIIGFIMAQFAIYALIAIPFRSYFQPLLVMAAIPFGLIGAVLGHLILGMTLTIVSLFGIVALTGVVVNDSLVLVDFVNRHRNTIPDTKKAVTTAAVKRFRPILLTTLTTFAGVTPLMLERSMQAQFLIPMAVSLGFGVAFGTLITLVFVPSGYLIQEDIKHLFRSFRQKKSGACKETSTGIS